jgi:hypothetical protein
MREADWKWREEMGRERWEGSVRCFVRILGLALVLIVSIGDARGEDEWREEAIGTMERAARFFTKAVATHGGYLWQYRSDLSMREGEGVATASMIWVQPPGTPSVGMAFLGAYEATGDERYLEAAREAAHALVWGQLGSGGWDYRIDFDAEGSRWWYYRRDVEVGDVEAGERRNTTTLDDDNTQSALRLLMQVDRTTGFADEDVGRAVKYGLEALLKAQYPNGAWPQRYSAFPDPEKFPVKKSRYPERGPGHIRRSGTRCTTRSTTIRSRMWSRRCWRRIARTGTSGT